MYASKEVEKRQRVVATELIQLEQQRRQVQSELRGLQKQQRMVEDEFGEIERQQRAIEAKLLEMQLRQKQVEYETQLKELIYEANTPVGMSYVRQLPARQRSVPRYLGRSATPDTLRGSYDSTTPYVLDRPHSAQMERRYLPGGSLQRGEGVPPSGRPRLKRSSSLKKLFSSLGRKDKHKDQYGDPSEAPPKKPGVLRTLKKKVNNATYSFYEAQKPYETVKFKKNKDGGATAYSDSPQPGTPTGLPPTSGKKSLHGKDANKQQPGGINIVRSNQQVNAAGAAEETPLKIRETKSYMVEESTDYLRKTYLPREEFSVTTSKAEFTEAGAPRPESLISVKEDTITPRLNKQPSRENAVRDAMGTLEKKENEGKKTLKEEAETSAASATKVESQTPAVAFPTKDGGVKVIVTEPEVDPAVKKETAAKEAKLMKMASGAETPKQQSVDKMESLEKMTNDNGHVEEKYKSLEAATTQQQQTVATAETTGPVKDAEKDDVGKWRVKRMDKVDIDMPSTQKEQGQSRVDLEKKKDEGQIEKEAEKAQESKIVAAVNQGTAKIEEIASDAKTRVQSARFRPVVVKKTEAPAPPGGEAQQQQPATNQQQPAAAAQPAGKTVSQPAATNFRSTPASLEAAQVPPFNQRQQPQPAVNQQQQQKPAIPSIQQVRVTNYDNIDFSHYYRSLTSPDTTRTTTGDDDGSANDGTIRDVGVEHAQTTCSSAYSDCTSDSGVSTLERPPTLKHLTPTGGAGGASMRTKPPISTAGARLIIDSNRNNMVDVTSEGHLKPRSRSADTVPKSKQSPSSKRSKSAEGPSTMKVREESMLSATENVSENNLPHPPPNTLRNTPESTPNETPKTTPRHTPKMLRRYFQPLKSGSPKGSPKTTPRGTPKGTPTGTPEDTPGGSPKESRRVTPKSLRRILQPVVENVVHAVKTSWDRHRPRSRSGSRSRGGSSSGSGSRDKSPDPFVKTTATPTCDVITTTIATTTTSYVTSYVTTVSAVGSDVTVPSSTPGNDVTGSNKSGSTITIDDTVVFLRRDISRRRSEAQKREKRSSRSMDRAGQETQVPEEMQVQPIRRSRSLSSVDLSELDNLDLPYVSMTYLEEKKRRGQEETPLNYNTEYDALIKRMNMLAEVAEHDLSAQARTQPQRIMYYDTGPCTP